MSSVLLPTLSSYQSEIERIKQIVRKVVQVTSYLIAPMMMGLAMVSEEIVVLLFTKKWLPAVPIMQANCLYYFATPFMLIFVQVFFAFGHSYLRVKSELIRMVLQIGFVFFVGIILNGTIYHLTYVIAVVAVVSALVTYIFAKKLIKYKVSEFLGDVYKPIVASGIMGLLIYSSDDIIHIIIGKSNVLLLVIKALIGVSVYFFFSVTMKMSGYRELKELLFVILNRIKG